MDLLEINQTLRSLLRLHLGPMKVRHDRPDLFEVAGNKETMQGKQKVDGIFFTSVVPKEKDVRFYFFPIYTHPDEYDFIGPETRKCLKGKSCFHIKKLSPEVKSDIEKMIQKGVRLYMAQDWV
jgi:hypothetical protein